VSVTSFVGSRKIFIDDRQFNQCLKKSDHKKEAIMKTKLITVFCIFLVVLFLGSLSAQSYETAPDPVADIQVVVLSKEFGWQGKIRIIGIVKNIGADYISKPHQQAAYLYVTDPTGKTVTNIIGQLDFTTLKAGQEIRLTYDTAWDTSREFAPCFKLVIQYDPDINKDGNSNNDDRDTANNVKTLCEAEINKQYRDELPLLIKIQPIVVEIIK
jgi:hypothetical protein